MGSSHRRTRAFAVRHLCESVEGVSKCAPRLAQFSGTYRAPLPPYSGGHYELIDKDSRSPNADYYLARLWKDAMGSAVFSVMSSAPDVRVYAHCAPGGGVTVAFINFSPDVAASLTFHGPLPGSRRDLRILSSPDNTTILLNGAHLVYNPGSGSLPSLAPQEDAGDGPLLVQPHTLGFITFPTAAAYDC